eukprot:symbB.v1.2.004588.t1/scaffold261.1/size248783/16
MTFQSVKCVISSLGYLALVACFVGVVNGCWEEHRGSYCLGLSGDHKSGSDSLEACISRCRSSACAAITYYADLQACYIAATRCDLNTSSFGGKVLVNYCQEVICPDHIMVSNLETGSHPFFESMFGVYSRVDGASYERRPVYKRNQNDCYLFYVDSTWDYDGDVGGTWIIVWKKKGYKNWNYMDVEVTSGIQFATCPHHATHFYEAKPIYSVRKVKRVPRNISMQEATFAELAAEWLRGKEYFGPLFCGGLVFFTCSLLIFLAFAYAIGETDDMAEAKVKQTLEEIKQLLQSPEHLPDSCNDPRSLESLESSVEETILQKQKLLHYYKRKKFNAPQVVSICVNVYMWLCLVYIVFENVSGLRDELDGRDMFSGGGIHGFVVGAFLVSYVTVLVESFCFSPVKEFLRDVREVQQASTVIGRMVALEPQLRMQACKFHLETQPLPLTDVWGNSYLGTFHGKEVTGTAEDFIPLRHWRDLSVGDVLGASKRGVTTLFVESIICAGDRDTLRIIDSRYDQFKEDHQGRHRTDAWVKFQLDYELPGVQNRLIICDNDPPWWMNRTVFYLASFLGLTWIYRLCLKTRTSSSTLVLVKRVLVGGTSDTSEA